jgi:ribosomal protein S17E
VQPATSPKPPRPETPAQHNSQQQQAVKMGRVRTKTVKKSAKVIIERYYPKLTLDFETNKRVCDEIAIIASKRLRNKVRFLLDTQKQSEDNR